MNTGYFYYNSDQSEKQVLVFTGVSGTHSVLTPYSLRTHCIQ
jgi:hypothetical protein